MGRDSGGRTRVVIEALEGRVCLSSSSSVHVTALPLPKAARHGTVGGVTVGLHGDVYYTVSSPVTGHYSVVRVAARDGKAKAFGVGGAVVDTLDGLGQTGDGRIWFVTRFLANEDDDGDAYVDWLDPKTGRTSEHPYGARVGDTDARPRTVLATPDGRLLILTPGGIAALSDARPDGVVTRLETESDGTTAWGMTLGPGGYLWVTETGPFEETASPPIISRVDAKGRRTVVTERLSGYPEQIVTGVDGALWFTESALNDPPDGGGFIGRVDLKGHVREYRIPSGADASGITLGPDGNVWFTEPEASVVGSIRPSGFVRERVLPHGFKHPTQLTSGPDGRMYFVCDGAVGRITVKGKGAGVVRGEARSAGEGAIARPALTAPFVRGGTRRTGEDLWDEV
jgi:streptogramin lyase